MRRNYPIAEITNLLKCEVRGDKDGRYISHLCTDSRQINITENCLFIALIGERFDGHHYIKKCIDEGIKLFLISDDSFIPKDSGKNLLFILVKDTLASLQQIAAYHRSQFSYPVIGIAGSNGKTIIKEWLFQLLQPAKRIIKSPKSFNSQIGVPLSVWNMSDEDELAIFEAGISLPNEMEKLEKIIRPTLGIFTNIGPAHNAGFSGYEEKIQQKSKLFEHSEKVIYCKDHKLIDDILSKSKDFRTETWGVSTESDYVFTYHKEQDRTKVSINHKEKTWEFYTKFTDGIALENVSHVITVALVLDTPMPIIEQNLSQLRNVAMRMELKYGLNDCLIIDDSYSADILSFEAGLNFLNEQKGNLKQSLIISALDQSGLSIVDQLLLFKQLFKKRNIHKLILIGEEQWKEKDFEDISDQVLIFRTSQDFIDKIAEISFYKEAILVKGGRKHQFEKIVSALQAKSHRTILEINLNKLIDNLNFYRSRLSKGTGIIAMVKAHSYGSGSTEIAYTLQANNVDYLAVAYADEGVLLRKNGVYIPIMVMNPSIEEVDIMIKHALEPSIYSLSFLKSLLSKLIDHNKSELHVHLKFETGMSRLGIVKNDLPEVIRVLKENPMLKIKSVFSHLAAADDVHENSFSLNQIDKFNEIHRVLENEFGEIPKHILNSAGILSFPKHQYDFVRLGIGLYGIDTTNTCQDKLKFISVLKTRVTQIKEIDKGESIGYGRSDIAQTPKTLAILAIGYADGYDRRFSNGNGFVYINGKRARTVGRICMDMTMVDITEIEHVKTGQFVEVFGDNISIIEAAQKIGTIPYELLTNVSSRVKRIYTWE